MNQQPYGHITSDFMGTKFTWTIDNFTHRYTATGEKFSSTEFFTGKDYKDEWCFEMYPKGQCESDKDFVCLSLRLLRTPKEEVRVNIMYSMAKLDDENSTEHPPITHPVSHQVFIKNMSNRLTRFVDSSDILNYLKNDTLKISCQITSSETRPSAQVIEASGTFPLRLCDHMWMLFQESKLSDAVVIVEDKQFHVHKLLLQIRSPVFAAMFEHNLKENQTNEIKIEEIRPEVVRKMLQFIYTDRIDNFEDIVRDLLVAADRYSLDGLTALCERVLCEQVTVSNAVATLILAESYNSANVKRHVARFINGNLPEIVNTGEYKEMEESRPALVSYLVREMATNMIKN
ncbi:speckle-type POZ protein A [Diachasma alloeum]|uniref:speckle-type POZ protein A n=1 Tax=Diachasma alloeum TaxID=454923 RepID=UPI00073815B4|nr:speckle-type POZ protein A [Diachasma alloeum]